MRAPAVAIVIIVAVASSIACSSEETECPEPHDALTQDTGQDGTSAPGDATDSSTNPDDANVGGTDTDPPPAPGSALETVEEHCEEDIGEPRVIEVADGLWVAIGYDLANTILLETSEGHVVIDVGMSPTRSAVTRDALLDAVPGDIAAIIYTHSHIDHVGGATVWADEETPIWATDAFSEHIVKQYGAFAPAETRRGNRQFGIDVPDEHLPCSALGRRADVTAALETGALMPTETFSDFAELTVGDVTIELHEAHGETHDQLYVWIPHLSALLPGDNYYASFPNLYTIRGTSPRPIDEWIRSLDRMRAHDPELLVPSHTVPVVGQANVREALRGYRDAIQWVRDAVVRGANGGQSTGEIARSTSLPAHLAGRNDLDELYGTVEWSARAIYTNNLGWFDEQSQTLVPPLDRDRREIGLMGGRDAVLGTARGALDDGDPRWALHLAGRLHHAGLGGSDVDAVLADALTATALGESNTNTRGWLLQRAAELRGEASDGGGEPVLNERLLSQLPVDLVFDVLPSRLKVEAALDVNTRLTIRFAEQEVQLTVRRGVAEVRFGPPLPGSPPASATIETDEETWKRIALGVRDPGEALIAGDLSVDDLPSALAFLDLFETGL